MLLVTIQNEFIIHLLDVYLEMDVHILPNKEKIQKIYANDDSLKFKIESIYLGQRVSSLFKLKMLKDIVVPNLTERELPIYEELNSIYRRMAIDRRNFELKFAYNTTAKNSVEISTVEVNRFLKNVDLYADKLYELQKLLTDLEGMPKVYLVTDILGVIRLLKSTIDSGRESIIATNFPESNTWIQNLISQSTKVQCLASSMSTVFDKFVTMVQTPEDSSLDMFNSFSPNSNVITVTPHQAILYQKLMRFVQNDSTPNFHNMYQVIIEAEEVQAIMMQNQQTIFDNIGQNYTYQNFTLASSFIQAINRQKQIYELVKMICTQIKGQSQSGDVEDIIEKTNSLEISLFQLESQVSQKVMDTQKPRGSIYDFDDNNLAPRIRSAITGLLNISWGYSKDLENTFKIQLMASRSMQQLFRLHKLIDSMVRNTEVENAINDQLTDEPWKMESLMKKMNTYNHLHFTAFYDKKSLAPWVFKIGQDIHESIKHHYWEHYSQHQPIESASTDRTHVILDISESTKDMNMFLMTDQETNTFVSLPQPIGFEHFKLHQNLKSMNEEMTSVVGLLPAQCIINKQNIRTFDQVTYHVPETLSMCRTVLTMDCSDEKTFAIILIKSNASYMGNGIQILYENQVIDVQPKTEHFDVMVDSITVDLNENKPLKYSQLLAYQKVENYLVITRNTFGIDVSFPLAGISLNVHGSQLKIQISELFKGRLCGLCGNFDSQVSWEYEGPFHELHRTPKSFAFSYVLPDSNCPLMQDSKYKYDLQYTFPDSTRQQGDLSKYNSSELNESPKRANFSPFETKNENKNDAQPIKTQDQCTTIDQRDVLQRKKKKTICYSQMSVAKCPNACPKIAKSTKQKANYTCLPKTPQNELLIKKGKWKQLETIPTGVVYSRFIQIPVQCKP
ncbi:hypothetical protein Btru_065129 [Bulinus truncatus]|nr:hypothetical protein Btru_065129 [Bulinus truncatus]